MMKNRVASIAFGLLMGTVVFLAGCESTQISDEDVVMVTIEAIDEAAKDATVVVVDVREPDKYAAGHIPGAVNIFLPETARRHAVLNNAKRIIVYGENPRDGWGTIAAKSLTRQGYVNVQEFKDGFVQWQREGRHVEGGLGSAPVRPNREGSP